MQRVYYATTILKIFSNSVKKTVHFAKICKENSMFFTRKLQHKVCLFPKNCNRKGTVSETALAQPRTNIRQVPPRAVGKVVPQIPLPLPPLHLKFFHWIFTYLYDHLDGPPQGRKSAHGRKNWTPVIKGALWHQ